MGVAGRVAELERRVCAVERQQGEGQCWDQFLNRFKALERRIDVRLDEIKEQLDAIKAQQQAFINELHQSLHGQSAEGISLVQPSPDANVTPSSQKLHVNVGGDCSTSRQFDSQVVHSPSQHAILDPADAPAEAVAPTVNVLSRTGGPHPLGDEELLTEGADWTHLDPCSTARPRSTPWPGATVPLPGTVSVSDTSSTEMLDPLEAAGGEAPPPPADADISEGTAAVAHIGLSNSQTGLDDNRHMSANRSALSLPPVSLPDMHRTTHEPEAIIVRPEESDEAPACAHRSHAGGSDGLRSSRDGMESPHLEELDAIADALMDDLGEATKAEHPVPDQPGPAESSVHSSAHATQTCGSPAPVASAQEDGVRSPPVSALSTLAASLAPSSSLKGRRAGRPPRIPKGNASCPGIDEATDPPLKRRRVDASEAARDVPMPRTAEAGEGRLETQVVALPLLQPTQTPHDTLADTDVTAPGGPQANKDADLTPVPGPAPGGRDGLEADAAVSHMKQPGCTPDATAAGAQVAVNQRLLAGEAASEAPVPALAPGRPEADTAVLSVLPAASEAATEEPGAAETSVEVPAAGHLRAVSFILSEDERRWEWYKTGRGLSFDVWSSSVPWMLPSPPGRQRSRGRSVASGIQDNTLGGRWPCTSPRGRAVASSTKDAEQQQEHPPALPGTLSTGATAADKAGTQLTSKQRKREQHLKDHLHGIPRGAAKGRPRPASAGVLQGHWRLEIASRWDSEPVTAESVPHVEELDAIADALMDDLAEATEPHLPVPDRLGPVQSAVHCFAQATSSPGSPALEVSAQEDGVQSPTASAPLTQAAAPVPRRTGEGTPAGLQASQNAGKTPGPTPDGPDGPENDLALSRLKQPAPAPGAIAAGTQMAVDKGVSVDKAADEALSSVLALGRPGTDSVAPHRPPLASEATAEAPRVFEASAEGFAAGNTRAASLPLSEDELRWEWYKTGRGMSFRVWSSSAPWRHPSPGGCQSCMSSRQKSMASSTQDDTPAGKAVVSSTEDAACSRELPSAAPSTLGTPKACAAENTAGARLTSKRKKQEWFQQKYADAGNIDQEAEHQREQRLKDRHTALRQPRRGRGRHGVSGARGRGAAFPPLPRCGSAPWPAVETWQDLQMSRHRRDLPLVDEVLPPLA